MRYMLFVWTILLVTSVHASAFGTKNCSNATGSLKRLEQEVLGENLVSYSISNLEVFEKDLEVSFTDEKMVSYESQKTHRGLSEWKTFSAKLTLKRKDGRPLFEGSTVQINEVSDWVICRADYFPSRD